MTYAFNLDDLEKKGLKQAAKQLARYQAVSGSDYLVAWVVQRSLGGTPSRSMSRRCEYSAG